MRNEEWTNYREEIREQVEAGYPPMEYDATRVWAAVVKRGAEDRNYWEDHVEKTIDNSPNADAAAVLATLQHSDFLPATNVDVYADITGRYYDAIGHARVLTVEKQEDQAKVMIEAVENQSPDIIIVDELSNKEECNAARTITGRGVAIVATVHGDGLASLLNDNDRSLLVGGVAGARAGAAVQA